MKRRILSLFVTLTMVIGLYAPMTAKAALNDIQADYNAYTGKLNITLPASPDTEAWLLAASYNEDGSLEDIRMQTLEAGAPVNQAVEHLTPASRYKVFLLEKDTIKPLSLCSEGSAVSPYTDLVTAKGTVYVPQIDGTVAHATAMAVDAYVESKMAMEHTISLFDDTTSTCTTGDNKTAKINKIAQIAESGTEYEKQMALDQIKTAKMAMEQVAGAAAVLDAAAKKDLADTKASINSYTTLCSSSGTNKEEALKFTQSQLPMNLRSSSGTNKEKALKWAEELSAKWDSLPKKERLRNFAEQMGVDARTAYQTLTDAQDIINGKYTDDAKFYDICTRVAIGVQSASKVGVFVCATVATGGAAAAAGGLTAAQATGMVIGGVDCCVEIGRAEAKILLGDDHKIVQDIENSTAMKVYDTTMFLYGAATFDPKTATTGEKLLFAKDLVEKNLETYENVKVLTDEATGLVIDRIDGEKKEIAVEYTRIQSRMQSDLAPAAQSILGAENTGIIGIDSSLNDGTVENQMQDFTSVMQSDDLSLAKTYSRVKDGDKTIDEKISEFKEACDKQVTYESPKKASGGGSEGGGSGSEGGDEGGGSGEGGGEGEGGEGGDGGGSSGGDGGSSYELNLPEPTMDYDKMETEYWSDTVATEQYYKDGNIVGRVEYIIDENGRYWKAYEQWWCDNGDSLVTVYYQKGEICNCEHNITITANCNGAIKSRYGTHTIASEYGWTCYYDWYDTVEYYPNGQRAKVERRSAGKNISSYEYAPNGRLYEYQINWDDNYNNGAGIFLNSYRYFVYPIKGLSFDPTGHIMEVRSGDNRTRYVPGEGGYHIYYNEDKYPSGWESA